MTYEKKSDLLVVTKAKELCSYIITVTQKSPKQFRFTFVSRLQNLGLDVIQHIYFANEIHIGKDRDRNAIERISLQRRAMTELKLIAYISELAMTQQCILFKQYEQIAKMTTDCQRLLGAWINSDKKRLTSKDVCTIGCLSGVLVIWASWWWLRSPGNNTNNAANVNNDGNVNINGNNVNNDNGGVRPALPQPRMPETLFCAGQVCAPGQRNQIPSLR